MEKKIVNLLVIEPHTFQLLSFNASKCHHFAIHSATVPVQNKREYSKSIMGKTYLSRTFIRRDKNLTSFYSYMVCGPSLPCLHLPGSTAFLGDYRERNGFWCLQMVVEKEGSWIPSWFSGEPKVPWFDWFPEMFEQCIVNNERWESFTTAERKINEMVIFFGWGVGRFIFLFFFFFWDLAFDYYCIYKFLSVQFISLSLGFIPDVFLPWMSLYRHCIGVTYSKGESKYSQRLVGTIYFHTCMKIQVRGFNWVIG